MEVIILDGAAEIGRVAADAIESLITRKPDAVLGLATGSSPLSIYDELAARHGAGRLSFAAVLSSAASLPTPEEEPSASPSSPPPPTCERARRQAGSHADYKEPSVNRKMRRPD